VGHGTELVASLANHDANIIPRLALLNWHRRTVVSSKISLINTFIFD
jgi:hypothetical protein